MVFDIIVPTLFEINVFSYACFTAFTVCIAFNLVLIFANISMTAEKTPIQTPITQISDNRVGALLAIGNTTYSLSSQQPRTVSSRINTKTFILNNPWTFNQIATRYIVSRACHAAVFPIE